MSKKPKKNSNNNTKEKRKAAAGFQKTDSASKNRKAVFWIPAAVFIVVGAVLAVVLILSTRESKDKDTVLEELQNQSGYIRTVGTEEYEFYRKLVVRDASEDISEEEIEEKTKEKITRANAEFLIGYKMGLCSAYSFESFLRDMENENNQRKIKKEKGEVYYGPDEFDLISYYNYISGNLKLEMVSYLTEHADWEMLDEAEEYFEKYKENYRNTEEISYRLTENGVTEENTLLSQDMSSLEKTDSELFEFLYLGKEGDEFQYTHNGVIRNVKITEVRYTEATFENCIERVMRDYITNIYLEDLIRKTAENNPVEFFSDN